MKLRDVLREDQASFTIDDKPGREYSINGYKGPERRSVPRDTGKGDDIAWRAGLTKEKDPNSKNWDIVTSAGKVLKTGLTKNDAEKIITGRQDLVSKYGQLKTVYHSRVGF